MPNREQILAELHLVANRMQAVASIWHIVVFIALIAFVSGWRPTRRTVALLLVPPVLSVAVLAWVHRSPFNGVAFTLLFGVLGLLGLRIAALPVARGPRWSLALGIAMAGFGFVYPHFVETSSVFWYLYAAPTAVVPCATLSFAIGFALIGDGFGSRSWSLVLAGAGLFYGIFGVARLGVVLDLGLVAGAAGLLARALASRPAQA
jgi:hypothetical protein